MLLFTWYFILFSFFLNSVSLCARGSHWTCHTQGPASRAVIIDMCQEAWIRIQNSKVNGGFSLDVSFFLSFFPYYEWLGEQVARCVHGREFNMTPFQGSRNLTVNGRIFLSFIQLCFAITTKPQWELPSLNPNTDCSGPNSPGDPIIKCIPHVPIHILPLCPRQEKIIKIIRSYGPGLCLIWWANHSLGI